MNSKKRSELKKAADMLDTVIGIVNRVCDQEQDAADNYPENLQNTDVYEAMENTIDGLNDALENLDAAKEGIMNSIC